MARLEDVFKNRPFREERCSEASLQETSQSVSKIRTSQKNVLEHFLRRKSRLRTLFGRKSRSRKSLGMKTMPQELFFGQRDVSGHLLARRLSDVSQRQFLQCTGQGMNQTPTHRAATVLPSSVQLRELAEVPPPSNRPRQPRTGAAQNCGNQVMWRPRAGASGSVATCPSKNFWLQAGFTLAVSRLWKPVRSQCSQVKPNLWL